MDWDKDGWKIAAGVFATIFIVLIIVFGILSGVDRNPEQEDTTNENYSYAHESATYDTYISSNGEVGDIDAGNSSENRPKDNDRERVPSTAASSKNGQTANPPKDHTPSNDIPSGASAGEANALQKAKIYLRSSNFSYEGLIHQLEFSGFTHSEATYGADHCGADWNQQALGKAETYLNSSAFSYNGLIHQLEFDKFTSDQATYGADHCGADWNQQALKEAKNYLKTSAFSYDGLIKQLKYEKFTDAQASYGADHCGADWDQQAVKCAQQYLSHSNFSRDELITQLEFEGFTHEQAVYGVEANGL